MLTLFTYKRRKALLLTSNYPYLLSTIFIIPFMKPVRFSTDPLAAPSVTSAPIQAAHWLKAGQLLAYPTESVWGIGCDPFNESAVAQLLAIKQRPIDKGMIVITDSVARIAPLLATLTIEQRQPILESWQVSSDQLAAQAQTWLLPLSNTLSLPIPSWITGAHNSVAVRVIAHPLFSSFALKWSVQVIPMVLSSQPAVIHQVSRQRYH